jgi:glycerol kinase
VGTWKSFAELASMAPERDVFEPKLDAETRVKLRQGWRLAVKRTRLQNSE